MRRLIMIFFVMFILSGSIAYAANTITYTDSVIVIEDIDSDWNWYDTITYLATSKAGIAIQSIQFNPGAADDLCIIKNKTDTGSEIFDVICADVYDQRCKYFNGEILKPVLDFSDGVYTAGSKVIIILQKRR